MIKIDPRSGKEKPHTAGDNQTILPIHSHATTRQRDGIGSGGLSHPVAGAMSGTNPLAKPTPEKRIQTGVTITPGMNRSRSVAAKSDDEHRALGSAILQDAADAFRCKR